MASGYLAEIEKMDAEVMESLRRHASEPAPMSNPNFPATSPKSALSTVASLRQSMAGLSLAKPSLSYDLEGPLDSRAKTCPLFTDEALVSVTHQGDTEVTRHAFAVLPVQGDVREEFSPLLYHLFASYVASYVATWLGRSLFQSDHPELLRSVDECYASLQRDAAH